MRQIWTALRAMLVLTAVLGLAYPLVVTGVGQLAFGRQADGSLVRVDGEVVGSRLLGQSFGDDPRWFQGRPSAAGDGYDGGASSGSNYGPENEELIAAVQERRRVWGVDAPADALTASGSGLDPDISPEFARLQAPIVAEARGLPEADVLALVDSRMQGRALGYLGEPRVNVLELNLALMELDD